MPQEFITEWILGASFLKKYYSIYDVESGYVGLARSHYDPSVNHWHQIKFFGLWTIIVVCVGYLIYETILHCTTDAVEVSSEEKTKLDDKK